MLSNTAGCFGDEISSNISNPGFSGKSANFVSSSNPTDETFSSNGVSNFLNSIFNNDKNIFDALESVEYRPIQPSTLVRSEEQIICNISGGDKTRGSCSSVALAYIGNRAGYIVYDFRNGKSRKVFSSRSSIEQIANFADVDSLILRGTDDISCALQMMENMESGKQYYLGTGEHAAIVRINDEKLYQYLELQNGTPNENGWHLLTQEALIKRFNCNDNHRTEYSNYLIELNSLQNNPEFLKLLGYINTDINAQVRGIDGYER